MILSCTVFIAPEKKATVKLPKGKYYVNEAYGVFWYGKEEMYGDEGYLEERIEFNNDGKISPILSVKPGWKYTIDLA